MVKRKYTEPELIDLLKDKSEVAFNALYDNYSPALYGIVMKIVNSEEAAQDVLQDSFVKIWKHFSNFDRTKGTLFTWLLNVARNTAIDYNRSKHVKYQIRTTDSIVSIIENQSTSKSFDHIGVKEAMVYLKPEYKEVIEILFFGGYTQEEASKELNLPLGTLKTRARTAIRDLRLLLKDKVSEQ